MATNLPVVRQIAWISLVPQLSILGLLTYGYYRLGTGAPLVWGPLTYLFLSFGLKYVLLGNHRQGMKRVHQGNFTDAIPLFEKSVAYFSKNRWVDEYRFVTLLDSSRWSYREMGLCNLAVCHVQTDDTGKAQAIYRQVMAEYPANELAPTGLQALTSGSSDNRT